MWGSGFGVMDRAAVERTCGDATPCRMSEVTLQGGGHLHPRNLTFFEEYGNENYHTGPPSSLHPRVRAVIFSDRLSANLEQISQSGPYFGLDLSHFQHESFLNQLIRSESTVLENWFRKQTPRSTAAPWCKPKVDHFVGKLTF